MKKSLEQMDMDWHMIAAECPWLIGHNQECAVLVAKQFFESGLSGNYFVNTACFRMNCSIARMISVIDEWENDEWENDE